MAGSWSLNLEFHNTQSSSVSYENRRMGNNNFDNFTIKRTTFFNRERRTFSGRRKRLYHFSTHFSITLLQEQF